MLSRTLPRAAAAQSSKAAMARFLKPRTPKVQRPAPPRLDEKEQAIFEALQKASTGAFSTPNEELSRAVFEKELAEFKAKEVEEAQAKIAEPSVTASSTGKEMHPDVQRGAKDEFEGEVNPLTGEVGGPKKEPLRWGAKGDWSYNGRVTDF